MPMPNFETGGLSLETDTEATRRIQEGSKVANLKVEVPIDLALQAESQAGESVEKLGMMSAGLAQSPESMIENHEAHVAAFETHKKEVAQAEEITRLKNSPRYRAEMRLVEAVRWNFSQYPDVQQFIQDCVAEGRDAYHIRNDLASGGFYSKGYTLKPGWAEAAKRASQQVGKGLDEIASKS